ncbi:MAG: hypothetical protein JOZ19_12365 [Rubrobacter sp.]|nr:hypothetical protein [Rubrobacter sp.]
MDQHSPCPVCRRDNPTENQFCGGCGASLTSDKQLELRREDTLPAARHPLPAKLKPVGEALAVILASIAAEAAVGWLNRRAGRNASPKLLLSGKAGSSPIRGRLVGLTLEEAFVQLQEGGFRKSWGFVRKVSQESDIATPIERHR